MTALDIASTYEHRPSLHHGWRGSLTATAAWAYNLLTLVTCDR